MVDNNMTRYVIWSREHKGWWRPGRRGYTPSLYDAGLYSKEEAMEICKDANMLWDGEGMPEEVAVPYAMMLASAPNGSRSRRKPYTAAVRS